MFLTNPQAGRNEDLSDEELLRRYCHDRRAADFEALFARHAPSLYRHCRHFLKNPEDSRDAVMQVFEKCIRSLPDRQVSSFRGWLFAMARNECIDILRQDQRTQQHRASLSGLSEPGTPPYGPRAFGKLHRAILDLSEPQRRCIELFYFEGLSYRDIAQLTRMSEGAVKSHLQNGRRRLRMLLDG